MLNSKFEDKTLHFFQRHGLIITKLIVITGYLVLFMVFAKFGFEFASNSSFVTFKALSSVAFFAFLGVFLFFIEHFSGGADFNLRWLIFVVELAVSGSVSGAFVGLNNNVFGWIASCVSALGAGIIILKFNFRKNA